MMADKEEFVPVDTSNTGDHNKIIIDSVSEAANDDVDTKDSEHLSE